MSQAENGSAWCSVVAGLASVATLPVAVYGTRFSDSYALLHASFAIPVAVVLGFVAIALSRRARMHTAVSLAGEGGSRVAAAGRILGILGLCMAASAVVALCVYGLLQYVGSRD